MIRQLFLLACIYHAFAYNFQIKSLNKFANTKLSKIGKTPIVNPSSSKLHANLQNVPANFNLNPRRFFKASKQLATLGPASSTFEMIEKLFLSGADAFRLNFSHGEHSEKANLVKIIRAIEEKYSHPICIVADLQGPKLRVGMFDNDKVQLVDGQKFTFDYKDELGDASRVKLPHPEILTTLQANDILLLDDGKLRMKVLETTIASAGLENGCVVCEVINGGKLSNKKGVNTPSIVLPISPLTPKDRRDLEFVLTLDVDWVALSFVQKPEDIVELKELAGKRVKVMAKLEKPSAINYLDEIVDLCDGIMVARGDLGVEMNPWDVPVIQKRIVETCKLLGKPVVIATQMLESMIESPTPTRAEASDVATAVFDSSDAVMLSAESAAGKFAVEAVTMQQLIINRVETDENFNENLERFAHETSLQRLKDATTTAITLAARQVADISKSKVIVAFTESGGTALRVAKVRPNVPIIAACYSKETARYLAIVWGIYPIVLDRPADNNFVIRDEITKICEKVSIQGFITDKSDLLTVTAGLPFGIPGTTNTLRVVSAAGPDYWVNEKGEVAYYGA